MMVNRILIFIQDLIGALLEKRKITVLLTNKVPPTKWELENQPDQFLPTYRFFNIADVE